MLRKIKDKIALALIWLSGIISLSILIIIIGYILKSGLQYINFDFIFNSYNPNDPNSGILPMIIGTIFIVVVSLLIAIPISIATALYLNEYSSKNKLGKIIEFAIDGLSSVPSIVYGLFGFALFVSVFNGQNILSGSFTMSIMITPVLTKTIQEQFKSIPNSIREASLALGASKTQTIFRVILPASISGIINAIILGMGRIVSESAPLILTAGMVYLMPTSLFDSTRTLTTHLYFLVSEATEATAKNQAFACAAILIIIVVILNLITKFIEKKLKKEM